MSTLTDKDYNQLKTELKALSFKWSERMGLRWYRIHFEWVREYAYHDSKDRHNVGAETKSMWQYREATITFYLEKLAAFTKEEREEVVIHELSHVLVSPIEDLGDDNASQMTEYTTTMVAKAVQWAYDDGVTTGKKQEALPNTKRLP